MPRPLAQVLCFGFVLWLWYRDQRRHPETSRALWIPTLWLLVLGSRPLSFWFDFRGGASQLEGNTFDRTVYLAAFLVSVVILLRRGVSFGPIVRRNWPVALFYGYLLATAFWADYPFVVFKRWIKDLENVVIVLIVLTDKDPIAAVERVFLRCAYALLPMSVLFIKYIPELGRWYSSSGGVMYIGVTFQKNALGETVMVFGLLILTRLLLVYDRLGQRWFHRENWINWLMLAIGVWLLKVSDSKTGILCLAGGAAVLVSYKLPLLRNSPKSALGVFVALAAVVVFLEATFNISDSLLVMMGRNRTLTNRTLIWEAVKEHPVDPLFGFGYQMYWDVYKTIVMEGDEVGLATAHNGYLETYLDGGWIGVGLLLLMLLVLGARVTRSFLLGTAWGRLQMTFFLAMVAYNMSESTFARRSPIWFAFLLFCLEVPAFAVATRTTRDSQPLEPVPEEGAPLRAGNVE